MKEVNKQSCPTGISRREFLGMAATGAAALTILPSFTVAGLGHVAPSDKLYIAKIGCGGMGAADLGSLLLSLIHIWFSNLVATISIETT